MHWLSVLLLPPSTQGPASLSVSLQFLSTAPPQKCVGESRCGCPILQSPDLLILKLQHLSGLELLASTTLGVETPGLYSWCAESHGQHGTCPKEVRRKQIWPHTMVLSWSEIPENTLSFAPTPKVQTLKGSSGAELFSLVFCVKGVSSSAGARTPMDSLECGAKLRLLLNHSW